MNRPLALHLKAALLCALIAIVLALPLLWLPMLLAWQGWRPPVVSPRVEAILAVIMALWVAWCVVDIPRRGLKVLIWLATLWLLGGGIWLAGLYGYNSSSLVPLTAAGLAGAGALAFSFTPTGSRRARWQSLVGGRVAPEFLRSRIDEQYLEEGPRSEVLAVAEVLWPGHMEGESHEAWKGLPGLAARAARHFHQAGGYLERCDGEGALFAFGLWGQAAPPHRRVRGPTRQRHSPPPPTGRPRKRPTQHPNAADHRRIAPPSCPPAQSLRAAKSVRRRNHSRPSGEIAKRLQPPRPSHPR